MEPHTGQELCHWSDPPGTHDFDCLRILPRSRMELSRCRRRELPELLAFAQGCIGGRQLAMLEDVERVLAKNPNSVLSFSKHGKVVGAWAMLLLNSRGIEALLLGEVPLHAPPQDILTDPIEPPSAIYIWAVVAPGLGAEGISHVSGFLQQPLYARANLYTRPATQQGARIMTSTGFLPLTSAPLGLHRYVRHSNRPRRLELAA